ncbi:hypothetical protein Tco_1388484 [Tanacetum coccineum]
MDQVHISSSESTARIPSLIIQPALIYKSNEIPEQNPHQPPIPYPSRLNKDNLQDKSDIQIHKFLQMFKKLHFNISLAKALAQMPKYAKMLKDLLSNKEKLLELANNPLNENCSAVLLKKLPKKLRDPGKFLIPCDFNELEECMALADLVIAYPAGIVEDVFMQVVDVHGEELTLRVGDEKLVFNVESTLKYPHKHGDDPTYSSDPVITSLSPSFTPFRDSVFLLEEIDALLALDDSIPPEIDEGIFNLEGDILILEKLLNNDSIKDLPPEELKDDEIKMTKSSIEEPYELELKDLPPHLKYTFLEGTSKLPVIITKDLREEEKDQLIKEKYHFMVKEGIVLVHKISKNGIEVDRAKVDVIAKLPPPTTVKRIRSFLGHAGFYQRFI